MSGKAFRATFPDFFRTNPQSASQITLHIISKLQSPKTRLATSLNDFKYGRPAGAELARQAEFHKMRQMTAAHPIIHTERL